MTNKINKRKITLSELPSGEELSLKVIEVDGPFEGPHCYIQASVHGAEHQGNAVIYKLLEYLEHNPIIGKITLLPMANPLALNTKIGTYTFGRFNANTGDNWNRLYFDFTKSSKEISEFAAKHLSSENIDIRKEYKKLLKELILNKKADHIEYGPKHNGLLNLTLQELATDSDYVLDLHTGGVATRYLYVPEYLEDRSKDLHFPHRLIIPNEFGGAMDEATFMPWVNLQSEFKKLGREFEIPFESYTVELGSEEMISLEEAQTDLLYILNYLHHRGIVENPPKEAPKSNQLKCKLKDYKTYYAPRGALYDYQLAPGEVFKKGDVLALGLNFENLYREEPVKFDVLALADGVVINRYPSSSVPSGAELIQVMENFYS
ncbi:succinylglutamate desuccinylase/aspartoacylase family protein [Halobacteriovorax sp. JY17]|uniref:succinylglutamate desuccinylase/aspartoacylase family protein n=1 Tax=Halobacteriovorax sp. JY17 TaxID=2014617 RepID=UPI000C3B8CF3|nr:succinylglutamate desuccinylase/aspartoacylase family protein [Halobacteriovorax sp. JY17]PIK15726.1 MAG: succinylglutamate desuccinylase [Halobacteriovorax sp. JY17]